MLRQHAHLMGAAALLREAAPWPVRATLETVVTVGRVIWPEDVACPTEALGTTAATIIDRKGLPHNRSVGMLLVAVRG
jgi:hypothetical protein